MWKYLCQALDLRRLPSRWLLWARVPGMPHTPPHVYCGRECQKNAWKEHKKVCTALKKERSAKKQSRKRDARRIAKEVEEALLCPCVDAAIDCQVEWSKALLQVEEGDLVSACRAFAFVIFVNNSFEDKNKTEVEKAYNAAMHMGDGMWGRVLRGVVTGGKNLEVELSKLDQKSLHMTVYISPAGTTFYTENEERLACAILHTMYCRQAWQGGRATESDKLLATYHLRQATKIVDPRRYLTLTFELAYTYRDTYDMQLAVDCYKSFLTKADPTHPLWENATAGLKSAEMMAQLPTEQLRRAQRMQQTIEGI